MWPKRKTRKISNYIKRRNALINTEFSNIDGGKPIASGGFGCVFYPSIKCKNNKYSKNFVSKLMIKKHVASEMRIINTVKKDLVKIPYYGDYFLVKDTYECQPSALTKKDKKNFNEKCKPLIKRNITAKNINSNLHKLKVINMPHSGIDLDKYWDKWNTLPETKKKNNIFGVTNLSLINLLRKGIFIMNKRDLYHLDIKGGNIMHTIHNENILDINNVKTRLIDWGLSMKYTNKTTIPYELIDRPFQYNLPFSSIIFQTNIQGIINDYIKKSKQITKKSTKQNAKYNIDNNSINDKNFIIEGLAYNIYETSIYNLGEGHLSYMIQFIDSIYNQKDSAFSIGKQIICEYIGAILKKYMNERYKLDLISYLQEVFLKNVDIWGFIVSYNNLITKDYQNNNKLQTSVVRIIKNYCFSTKYAATKIPMTKLINDLLYLNYTLGVSESYNKEKYNSIKFMENKE